MREALRVRHYSYRTEQTYLDWARRFILFHGKRHPAEMGAAEVAAFLTHLAAERQVSASTQNQTKVSKRLPVVLTPREVRALMDELNGTMGLIASLLYGTGMRLLEGLRLRLTTLYRSFRPNNSNAMSQCRSAASWW